MRNACIPPYARLALAASLLLLSGCGVEVAPRDQTSVAPQAEAIDGTVPENSQSGTPAGDSPSEEAAATIDPATLPPIPVTIGLPFAPNVQFAPFYVADAMGFYDELGFDVTFEYGDESDFVRRVASHELAATVASGEQVILASAADIPVQYVMTWYHRSPVAVFSLSPLESPADLSDMTVGLPQSSGASYTGFSAMLMAADVDPDTVDTEVIGYTQVAAVDGGTVDAAVGYAVNEPVQLRAQGHEVSVLEVADWFNFVSNGLVVSTATVRDSPDLAQALVAGTLNGIEATLDDPDAAFQIVLDVVPEAGADPETRELQRAVLEESLRFWRPAPGGSLGAIDLAEWERSRQFLIDSGGLTSEPPPVEEMVDIQFVATPE